MNLICVEKVLEELKNITIDEETEKSIDKKLTKILINNIGIPYLSYKTSEIPVSSLAGIETIEVYPKIYRVTKVLNKRHLDIQRDDMIINPYCLPYSEIHDKDFSCNTCLNIVRITDKEVHMFTKKLDIELKNVIDMLVAELVKEMIYIRMIDFAEKAGKMEQIFWNGFLVLDLRNNRGGKLIKMKKTFEEVFSNFHLTGRVYEEDKKINFSISADSNVPIPNVIILMNNLTASSAEIFIRLCKYYFHTLLVGSRTYGKNVICKDIELDDFHFSMPQYRYTIEGKEVDDGGITPDIFYENMDLQDLKEILTQCSLRKEDKLVCGNLNQ